MGDGGGGGWDDRGVSAGVILAVAAVFGLAAVVQSVTGFGFALVAVPLLALVLGPAPAVVATTLVSLLISVAVLRADRSFVDWRHAGVVSLAGLAAMPLGLWVLTRVPERALTAVIAVVLLVSTAVVARGLTLRPGRTTEVTVGAASGVLLTSTGMNGPPLVVAFQAQGMAPRPFRGTLSAVFLVEGVAAVALLTLGGQLTREALLAAAVGVPMMAVGWLVGNRVFHRLDAATFRRLVLWMLVASAVVALVSALRA